MTELEEKSKKVVNEVTNLINNFSDQPIEEFVKYMNNEHRTLQQSFTKLALKWIENCASEEYRHDGRNQASHETSAKLLKLWLAEETTYGVNPSHLPCI